MATSSQPPSGTIAMLFTDIEGSTRLASSLKDGWSGVQRAHNEIVETGVGSAGGWIDGRAGDGFFVTFADAAAAGQSAVSIQQALRREPWPAEVGELKVRMGLHVGQVQRLSYGYSGLEIHRAARVGAAAHGGQILMTGVAAELLREVVPSQALGAHRLKDFPAPVSLFCAVVDGRGAASFPPPRTLELREGRVPAAPVGVVGRSDDLQRVRAALDAGEDRLVTLLGRGGVGKSTLALAVANEVFGDYDGGVWWIEASGEREAAGLCALIARECRCHSEHATEDGLIADLGARGPLLLVLDNLEQVSGAGALLGRLLANTPKLRVLATSQLPTGCGRERRLRLDTLGVADGLALLSRCAERLDVPFAEDPAWVELVQVLDGLPLALELAIGRSRLFGPAELLRRLRDSASVLQDRARPDRHRSLLAALRWTLDLLDAETRELFLRLGVFAGPVELSDIEAVLGGDELDVVSGVEVLLEAALLQSIETGDGLVRFGFPEAVRQLAAESLDAGGAEQWRRAHAIWQRDLLWPARIYEIVESRRLERAHQLAAETRAAIEWAWLHDQELASQIALGRYALASRAGAFEEARELLDRLDQIRTDDPAISDLVREHQWLRRAAAGTGDEQRAGLTSLFAELTDPHARYLCALNASIALTWAGSFDEALQWSERALELGGAIGPLAEAGALLVRADTLLEAERIDEAEQALADADAVAGSLRSVDRDRAELVRAQLISRRGAHADALDRFARSLTAAERTGDVAAIHMGAVNLVGALGRAGRERAMLEVYGIALAISAREGIEDTVVSEMFGGLSEAVSGALARFGEDGDQLIAAGRDLDESLHVKRMCALIYARSEVG